MQGFKVRGWSKTYKLWCEYVDYSGSTDSWTGYIDGHVVPGNDLDVAQYSGRNDKKGSEVYAGDVVGQILTALPASETSGLVVVKNGSFVVNGKNFATDLALSVVLDMGYELIGNINENPELLK